MKASVSSVTLPRSGQGVRVWLVALFTAAAFFLLFGGTLFGLLADWSHSGEYGHGFLLLPVALYLAWKRRRVERRPAQLAGLLVIGTAVLLFLVGTVAAEFFTRRFAILLTLVGLTLYFTGIRQLRAWWLPVSLLAFTIPLPEVVLNSLTLPLQMFASRIAVSLLEFRHVPAALAGNIIFLPGQQLFVAEACSGLRSVSALLGLTLLIGGTALATPVARLSLMALAVPAALAANAFRVFATGYAAYFWGPGVTEGSAHELAGIGVFALAYSGVGIVAWGLRRLERRATRVSTTREAIR